MFTSKALLFTFFSILAIASPLPDADPEAIPEAENGLTGAAAQLDARAAAAGGIPWIAKFDDRFAKPLTPYQYPVGYYAFMVWSAWGIQNNTPSTPAGLAYKASSSPNVAVTSATLQALQNSSSGFIAIGPGLTSFTFDGFDFGCITDQPVNGVSPAISCTLLVTGYNAAGQQVAQATVTQAPENGQVTLNNALASVVLNSFAGIKLAKVGIIPIKALLGLQNTAQTSVLVDNVKYTLYK